MASLNQSYVLLIITCVYGSKGWNVLLGRNCKFIEKIQRNIKLFEKIHFRAEEFVYIRSIICIYRQGRSLCTKRHIAS